MQKARELTEHISLT